MHKIDIYTIEKEEFDEYKKIEEKYKKMMGKFAKVRHFELFNKSVAASQKTGRDEARACYSEIYTKKLGRFNICLDENGRSLDSIGFSKIFEREGDIRFFIGGAYGFEDSFIKKCDMSLSLSKMTFSHKIAKIVLFEQIYRALTIVNAHPYHK